MPRKKNGAGSIKRDKKTSQPLERGESPESQGTAASRVEVGAPQNAPRAGDRSRHSAGSPRPRRKTDDSLSREIHEILTADPELGATDIEVLVEGGAVTLSGDVEHPDAKFLAEELTESVSGVRLVHNRLVVRR